MHVLPLAVAVLKGMHLHFCMVSNYDPQSAHVAGPHIWRPYGLQGQLTMHCSW